MAHFKFFKPGLFIRNKMNFCIDQLKPETENIYCIFRAKSLSVIIIGLILSFSFACNRNVVFDKYENIPDEKWDRTKPVQLTFSISDTTNPYDLYINIRNSTSYRYANLYLFLHTRFPNGKTSKDTIECILAAPDGKWIGKGFSDLRENNILLRKGMKFPLKGQYQLSIEQAMRVEVLEGISDIGISILKP